MSLRILLLVFALVLTTAMAQTPGGSTTSCTNTIASLSPCLAYVTGNSTTPSASCCSQLSGVVKVTPQCLCTLINGGGPSFLTINQTLALALPGACKVQTPPVSQCKASPPESSTSPAPTESSNDTPEPAITPTASPSGDGTTGTNTVPSTTGGTTSDATIASPTTSVRFMLVGVLLAAAAIARF
ncbi:unnamed protein product [Linum tenue]|uniref:Bifunctional inhibitor/plant lipid transfer protein/seed storage helical domain-containing protein n=1 Tax=Linum tenue TaxID=586396 RepID=A0AAV0LHG5_9ROSI|nr:unnamed protein product [Linum tenue]